jgi:hypothetical protein
MGSIGSKGSIGGIGSVFRILVPLIDAVLASPFCTPAAKLVIDCRNTR